MDIANEINNVEVLEGELTQEKVYAWWCRQSSVEPISFELFKETYPTQEEFLRFLIWYTERQTLAFKLLIENV